MGWKKYKLAECCISISDGDHQPPPKAETGIPFVTISNIDSTNHFDFDNVMYVPQAYYDSLDNKRKARKNDILYSVVGSFGIPVLIKEATPFVFQRHIAILRPNDKVEPRFLYYTMLSRDFYMKADAAAIGAAQRTVSLTALRNMSIDLPCIDTQRRIADILSAYDDLIENNRKQIKLLEEAAQRLYKEWFVDLRFPGWETTEIVDGVPVGWKKVPVGDTIEHEIGGGWGNEEADEYFDAPAYIIRGTDLHGINHGDYSNLPFRYHKQGNLNARKLQDRDIIFEVSGGSKTEGVAKTLLLRNQFLKQMDYPVMCASFCKLVRTKKQYSAQYMFDTFQYMRRAGITQEYDKKSASSIVNYRWKDFLSQQMVLIPESEVLEKYAFASKSVYDLIIKKSIAIEKAKQARDRLLPKLMSGKLEV